MIVRRGYLLRATCHVLLATRHVLLATRHSPVHLREVEVRLGEGAIHVKDDATQHGPGRRGHAARARHSGEMRATQQARCDEHARARVIANERTSGLGGSDSSGPRPRSTPHLPRPSQRPSPHSALASLPQFGFGVVVHQHPRRREGRLNRQSAEAGRAVELTRLHGRVADALELRE